MIRVDSQLFYDIRLSSGKLKGSIKKITDCMLGAIFSVVLKDPNLLSFVKILRYRGGIGICNSFVFKLLGWEKQDWFGYVIAIQCHWEWMYTCANTFQCRKFICSSYWDEIVWFEHVWDELKEADNCKPSLDMWVFWLYIVV